MAPVPQLDLDLAKCFKGEQQLISWKIAYNALCDPDTAAKSAPLRSFLTAEENLEILSRPWKPFPEPSAQEKSKFDSKTAPISVPPAQGGPYNIDEIKEDSLWLAKEANISEYAALRLVVQEWQNRPAIQLLSGLTEEEALSVQEAAGLSSLGASTFVPNSSILANPSALGQQAGADFDSSDQRRLRIIDIYHSTCACILRVSQLLLSWGCAKHLRSKTTYGRDYRVADDWLEQLGQAIAVKQNQKDSASAGAAAGLDKCIRAIKARLDALDNGYTWSVSESIYEQAYERWATGQTTELLHILHVALIHADLVTKDFIPSAIVEAWFSTLSEPTFFRDFPTRSINQQPLVPLIQLLTSLVSLAVLKINLVLDDIDSGRYTSWPSSVYVLDGGLLERVTTCFLQAVELGPSPAIPAAFAWAIITFQLSTRAGMLEEERERLLDSLAASGGSPPSPTALEDAVLPLLKLETLDNRAPFQVLAENCSSFGVLPLITQLITVGMAGFGTSVDLVSRDQFRLLFLRLLRAALGSGVLEYSEDLIRSAHTIMVGDRTFQTWIRQDVQRADPIVSFCQEDEAVLRPALLQEARLRYPYETAAFLKFFSALTRGDKAHDAIPTVMYELTQTRTLMQRLPEGFIEYRLEQEEENANHVSLSVDLPQFVQASTLRFSSQRRLLASTASMRAQESMIIPANTKGTIVDDRAQPFVAVWHYHHSALEYLTHLLSTYVVGSNKVEYAKQEPASTETAADTIGFFADLIHSSLQASRAQGDEGVCSAELLAALDVSVDHSQDTVSIVLAIFEEELLRLCQNPGNEGSLELLVNCTHFLQALVAIAPNRVWPWLARSRLLESDGNGGSLATILIGTEMVVGRYDFLIGCIQLFHALVDDAVERSVARKSSSKALTRFNATTTSDSGTSEKIMRNTLLTFARTLASIYESSLGWKYERMEDRLLINIGICEAFTTVLLLAYSDDDSPQLSQKLTKPIGPTAEYITELYLTKSENNLPTNPILASLLSGADLNRNTLLTSSTALWKQQTRTTLQFCDLLVRVAVLLNKPWTHLEQQLFKATPLLARLYATSDVWKPPVVLLLETLVRGAIRVVNSGGKEPGKSNKEGGESEPPSLLGHLGPRTAKNFLSVLSQLDEPLRIADVQTNVWKLLSAVVTCKQQWFALYLLTGSTPRESVKVKKSATADARSKALLSRALEALSLLNLDAPNRPWPLYTAMLEFVTAAQDHWSWAMGDLRQRKNFVQQLLDFLKWMARQSRDLRTENVTLTRSHQNKFASLTCEILAMYLHSCRQIGDITTLKDVVSSLAYLENNALELPSYNVSLHSNLKQNIEQKFPGVSLANIKRTTLYPADFGESFFYDIELANKLLGFDTKWTGPRPGQGFQGEVVRANINLSLVESQVLLLQSWRLLAIELSQIATKHNDLTKLLVEVVRKCMTANANSTLPEALFGELMALRADLAFAVLKKLVDAKIKAPEARELLKPIWDAIRASTADFDNIFSSEQVQYYRSLLRILYLSLQFHLVDDFTAANPEELSFRSSFRGTLPTNSKTFVEPISNQLLEILSETVAKGFRSLATQLHADPSSVSPSDFALLTALLQRILAIPEMSKWHAQAALLFANSNTIRYATSLFSWSDKLTISTSNGGAPDPVYGELSLLFLLSLSSLPALAETMAVEGILSQLNTANLMNYFRRPGGMGPYDAPARMHSLWTKGLLPLCLNLLFAVNAPFAAEITSFLNQFPAQLARSANALNARHASKITLAIASETHSLALISEVLEDMRRSGPRLGIQASEVPVLEWDREAVKEDVEGWLARKGALRERVAVLDERDAELFARKVEDGNMLEERVLAEIVAAGVCLGLVKEKV